MKSVLTLMITFDQEIEQEELHHAAEQIFKHLEREYHNYHFNLTAIVAHKEEFTNG